MLLRFAFKDIFRHWRFSLFFVLNLTIGLSGFITIETFKDGLESYLKNNAREILGADLSVSVRREFSIEEQKVLNGLPQDGVSVGYDFFAMASTPKNSRLVLVKAIDDAYPLYGDLEGDEGRALEPQDLSAVPKAWLYPEAMEAFGIKTGEKLKLGSLEFEVVDKVVKDSTLTFRSASLAPRVFIHVNKLPDTGLIQFGSTFTKSYFFKLKAGDKLELRKEQLLTAIPDPAVRVETPETAGEDSGRQLKYLSDYLGLVTLIALFLSALGAAYLYRLFLQSKLRDIAIFRSLGLKGKQALQIFLIETALLGFVAVLIASLMTTGLFPVLTVLLGTLLPIPIALGFSLPVFLTCLVIAILGSMAVSLPFLLRIQNISVSQLFSEDHFQSDLQAPAWWSFLPGLILFVGLSIYQANSYRVGGGFSLGLMLSLAIFAAVGYACLTLVSRWPAKTWSLKFSILAMKRRKVASLALFVSLSLGALLINILPQLKVTLQSSMEVSEQAKLPALFLFDIQDDQVSELSSFIQSQNIEALSLSPMVRGRILKVNGEDYERAVEDQNFKTREEEREARFRNRGVNITYRQELTEAEEITEGRPFSSSVNPEMAEVSLEFRYADRLDLKVGDILTFDIQGVELQAKVVSLRSVKWTSFQPNFFVTMQPGFLEDAPKIFITALPRMELSKKQLVQQKLVQNFPNISIIDVDRLVQDVLNLAEQMSLSLEFMAWLSLLAGYVVLYSIVRSQVNSRRWELNMLKILGAKTPDLRRYLLAEVVIVSLSAASFGALISVAAASALSLWLFEMSLKLNVLWLVTTVLGICLISVLVAWLAAQKVVKEKPHHILGEG